MHHGYALHFAHDGSSVGLWRIVKHINHLMELSNKAWEEDLLAPSQLEKELIDVELTRMEPVLQKLAR